ncbi:hypothetical protein [Sorangium sp. So ce426]|uniref:hypothetical protein n=1 Tax=Sorangium sp. So ce426 TaxID=3133312 RepID=UPI003F5B7C5D
MKRAARAALASMAAGAMSVVGVTPVRAEPTPTPLRVRIEFIRGPGAEDCPDEPFLRAETARAMGGVDPYDAEAPFTMTASIERRHGKLAASLFLRDGDGHGRWADGFSARDDCKVLVTAMSVSTLTTDVVFCLDRRSLFACGLAELGVRHTVAAVPLNTTSRLNLRAGFGARASIEWPLSENCSARAHTDVVHPVTPAAILRHPGDPEPERPVWSAPAVTVALGVGLQASF